MTRLARIALSAAMLAGTTAAVRAADEIVTVEPAGNPWYLELQVGAPLPRDYNFTFTTTSVNGSYDPQAGAFFAGAIGKYFNENIRADINVSYAWGHDGSVTLATGGAPIPHTGSVAAISITANGYYEFPDVLPRFTPWVGAGGGVTIFDYNNLGGPGFQYNDSDTALTLAGQLGADYAITDNVDLTGRYMLTWTDKHSIATTVGGGSVPFTASSQVNNIFTIGVRVKFGG